MLPTWRIRFTGLLSLEVFALTTTWACIGDSLNLYEIKIMSSNSHHGNKILLVEPEQCVSVEQCWSGDSRYLNTEGNCLELWSEDNCNGDVMYFVSSGDDGMANVSLDFFDPKSVKLCEPSKQRSHRVVRRGLVENSTEYYFWAFLSKIRGRSEIFMEEFRKGGGHPDWETILGGRNWQGPRSKLYLKALYKVVNVFKTYCDMDMKWSRYTTAELANIRQLAADVVRLREIKALKFPHTDPQSKVHLKIVDIWKNITITLTRAHDLKTKYDQSVKLAKLSNAAKTIVVETSSQSWSAASTSNKQQELGAETTLDGKTTTMTASSTKSMKKSAADRPCDESFVKIVD